MARPEKQYIYDIPNYDDDIENVRFREESLISYNEELKKRISRVLYELNKKGNEKEKERILNS